MVRFGQSWQIMLADLSLILFIATAAALDAPEPERPIAAPTAMLASGIVEETEPVAVFRADSGSDFAAWLAGHGADPRERLTIQSRYVPGNRDSAFAAAEAYRLIAENAGYDSRLVIEPGASDETFAMFAFYHDPQMARELHESASN